MISWRVMGSVLLMSASGMAAGQAYPTHPLRMVTAEAGGGSDFAARVVARGLTVGMGQQVVVENQGGAGGIVAAQTVARAQPDGYTVLFHGNPIWFLPLLQDNVPYDPIRDFAMVTLVDISPLVVVVHPSLPVRSIKQLISLGKAKPGLLNYASGVTGSTPHLAAELFKSMAHIQMVRITYKGTGPALNDMISGQVQVMFATPAAGMPHVKSGRLIALAVTSAKPSAVIPGLPSIAESGLPGYESINSHGLFAPAKTPAAIIARLHDETVRYLSQADTKAQFLNAGIEAVGSTPEAFQAAVKTEMSVWGKLFKEAGIRAE